MALRSTRQFVQVLAEGQGAIRATRQFVQILGSVDSFAFAETDTIAWVDAAASTSKAISVEDTIVFTELARNSAISKDAEDVLTLTDTAVVQTSQQFPGDSLIWTDEAIGHIAVVTEVDSSDTLTFTDSASTTFLPDTQDVVDTLVYIQDADYSQIGRSLEDTIPFVDQALVNNTTKTANPVDFITWFDETASFGTKSFSLEDQMTDDYVTFDPDTGVGNTIHYGLGQRLRYDLIRTNQIEDFITFNDAVSLIHVKLSGTSLLSEDTINWTDAADSRTEAVVDTISFVDSASSESVTTTSDLIEWTDEVTAQKTLVPTIVDDFNITDSVGYTMFSGGSFCQYSPEIGSTSDPNAPKSPSPTTPNIVPRDSFTLFYPYSATPTDVVDLRVPDFGNTTDDLFQRIKRETRGGTLVVFADPIWPQNYTMSVTVTHLKESEAQALQDFVQTSLGRPIGIQDWNSQYWVGILTSPEAIIVRDGVTGNSVSLTITLQSLKENLLASDTINWTDSAAQTTDEAAISTLVWSDSASRQFIATRDHDISFIGWFDSLVGATERDKAADDTIIWTQEALVQRIHVRSITDNIIWTDTAAAQHVQGRTIDDTLLWTDTADREATLERAITDPVIWSDVASRQYISSPLATDTVVWTDTATVELTRVRYWLGTTSAWNLSSNWSLTSGGAGGAGVPDQYTDVILDGNGTGNCTLSATTTIKSMDMQAGYTGVFSQNTQTFNVDDITLAGNSYTISTGTLNVDGHFDASGLTAFTRGTSTITMNGASKDFKTYTNMTVYNLTINGDTIQGSNATFIANTFTLNARYSIGSSGTTLNSTSFTSDLVVNTNGILDSSGPVGVFSLFSPTAGRGVSVFDGLIEPAQFYLFYPSATGVLAPGYYNSAFSLRGRSTAVTETMTLSAGAYRFKSLQFIAFSSVPGTTLILDCSTNAVTDVRVDGQFSMTGLPGPGTAANFQVTNSGQTVDWLLKGSVDMTGTTTGINTWTKGNGTLTLAPTANQNVNFNSFSLEDVVVTAGSFTTTFQENFTTDSYLHSTGTVNFGGKDVTTTNDFTISAGAQTVGTSFNGCAFVIGGNFSVTGQALLELDMHAASAWTMVITGTAVADYVNVDYSDASLGTNVTATNSTDGGNNNGWSFV